jgi:hypothetical protein
MKKALFISFILFLILALSAFAQLQAISALSDFYSIYGNMQKEGKELNTPIEIKYYLTTEIKNKLSLNITYRVAFIGQVAARCGFNSGITSLQNIDNTISALTGFLMIVEEINDISIWSLKEITHKYDRLLQTSWTNTNPPLFTLILQTYCSYKSGELGW